MTEYCRGVSTALAQRGAGGWGSHHFDFHVWGVLKDSGLKTVVPEEGVEPTHSCLYGILSPELSNLLGLF